MTGAVWANESWGRYWGWDAKETGALVAWLTYAGFLHSRIAYGWKGRRSAYFALFAFLFVVFTPGCQLSASRSSLMRLNLMTKENILFVVIGLLAGLMLGFVFANSVNQRGTVPVAGTGIQNANMPAGHPEVPGAAGAMQPEIQAAIDQAKKSRIISMLNLKLLSSTIKYSDSTALSNF